MTVNKILRQGDVLLVPCKKSNKGEKLNHLTLALGEVTGHSHRITSGTATLYKHDAPLKLETNIKGFKEREQDGVLYLEVDSDVSYLTHEEHEPQALGKGTWAVLIQREYSPEGWNYVAD